MCAAAAHQPAAQIFGTVAPATARRRPLARLIAARSRSTRAVTLPSLRFARAGAQLSAVLQISATETFFVAREKAKAAGADRAAKKRSVVTLRTQDLRDVRDPAADPARESRYASREAVLKPNSGLRPVGTSAASGAINPKVLDQYAPGLAQWLLAPQAVAAEQAARSRYRKT